MAFTGRRVASYVGAGAIAMTLFSLSDTRTKLYPHVVMPALRLLDPERSHRLAIVLASWGLSPRDKQEDDPVLRTTVWGLPFRNPVGLAAGFDKHAEAIDAMGAMGFGFVEIGSVTPQPQPGNARPRVFRLLDDGAVINRYGFNSDGHALVKERLVQRAADANARADTVLGINLGKNKTSTDAAADYAAGVLELGGHADYIVVNVSSPNTPGLRVLQGREELTAILRRVQEARATIVEQSNRRPPPLLVKIAPDLNQEDMKDVAAVALSCGVDGLIVSNTTIARPEHLKSVHKGETGGLSGRPLRPLADSALAEMYRLTAGRIPIIGVGGVESGEDAYRKIRLGASLVQFYTAFSLQGPRLLRETKDELAALLKRDGFVSVAQAVGVDNPLPPGAKGAAEEKPLRRGWSLW